MSTKEYVSIADFGRDIAVTATLQALVGRMPEAERLALFEDLKERVTTVGGTAPEVARCIEEELSTIFMLPASDV